MLQVATDAKGGVPISLKSGNFSSRDSSPDKGIQLPDTIFKLCFTCVVRIINCLTKISDLRDSFAIPGPLPITSLSGLHTHITH